MFMKAIVAASVAALLPLALPTKGEAPAPNAKAPRVVTITTMDYAFEAPTSLQAGTVTIRLVNKGKELHHAWIVKLEQGKTFADVQQVMKSHGPPPEWMVDVGGPNPPAPGGTAEVTLTLEPGNYLILCFIPGQDHVPHVAKGMFKQLTVTGPAAKAEEPKADVVMTLDDYDFRVDKPLAAGRQVVLLENAAQQPHEVVFAKLAPGKTVQELVAWIDNMQGPPPGMPMGGATGIVPGRKLWMTLNLEPGRYGLICFVPDKKDGKAHLVHGMMKEFDVAPAKVSAK